PGELFGELILIDEPRPFAAIALTDIVVAFLPSEKLRHLLSASPGLSRNYLRLVSLRLHEMERSFPTLVHLWPHHRLARELLHLAEDLGNETPRGTRMALRLTHEDLANLIGSSRETVTLLLHKFEEMGLVWREGRDLLLRRKKLEEYLAPK
ncbi:MAG: Crp/Fnr family transcriptional regulator, partial [Verrucomicrobiota bacterium]